jgi:hypothetical protein
MKKLEIKVGYQNRSGVYGDLPAVCKIIISNKELTKLSGFVIGDILKVHYFPDSVVLIKSKINI